MWDLYPRRSSKTCSDLCQKMGDYTDAFNRNNAANNNAAVQARTKAQNRANVMQLKLVLSLILDVCANSRVCVIVLIV